MNIENLIVSIEEVTKAEIYSGYASSIFLVKKDDTSPDTYVANVKLIDGSSMVECPIMVGVWNPFLVVSVNVTADMLEKYRVFVGH